MKNQEVLANTIYKEVNPTEKNKSSSYCITKEIDLNLKFIRSQADTFLFKMKSDAMKEAGIFDGDTLIMDRSVPLTHGKIVVAILNGELLVRRFHKNFSSAFLVPENNRYKNINLAEFTDIKICGVVTYVIHPV